MNNKYARAYTEVVKILECIPKEEYNKIPKEKIEFYMKNMDRTYEYHYDPLKPPDKQQISREANAIIITLFRDYFIDNKKREILNKILMANEEKHQEELRKRYNPNNVFKNKKEN